MDEFVEDRYRRSWRALSEISVRSWRKANCVFNPANVFDQIEHCGKRLKGLSDQLSTRRGPIDLDLQMKIEAIKLYKGDLNHAVRLFPRWRSIDDPWEVC